MRGGPTFILTGQCAYDAVTGMDQHPTQRTLTPPSFVAMLGNLVSGTRQLAKNVRREFRLPGTPWELQAYEAGFEAGIHAAPLSDCPYVYKEQAEMWHKGWKAGRAQTWWAQGW